jgi:outer membrane immunogenic protein
VIAELANPGWCGMYKAIAAGALALGLLTGAAQAAPVYDWTGFYLGGFVGGVSGKTDPDYDSSGPSGFDAGLSLAYAWQTHGNWVFTPFVVVPIAGQVGTANSGYVATRIDWSVIGGVKIGYAQDRWQPYAMIAGLLAGGSADDGTLIKRTHSGLVFGVGADYALTDRWSVGARFVHITANQQDYGTMVGFSGNSFAGTIAYKLK